MLLLGYLFMVNVLRDHYGSLRKTENDLEILPDIWPDRLSFA